jgi:hypothetical protein
MRNQKTGASILFVLMTIAHAHGIDARGGGGHTCRFAEIHQEDLRRQDRQRPGSIHPS